MRTVLKWSLLLVVVAWGVAEAQEKPERPLGTKRPPNRRLPVDDEKTPPTTPPPSGSTPPRPAPGPAGPVNPPPATPPVSPPPTGFEPPGEAAATDCVKLRKGKKYKWDQKGEIDLASLLAWAQSSFCQPIIVPANLRQQKITIYAPTMLTPEEMYRMFLSSLNAMGLTVQPQGPAGRPTALMVIESSRARETAIPTLGPHDPVPRNDSFVTKVQRLEHLSTEEVLPILTRLKSQPGDVVAAPPSTLIITDVAENIRRMEEVLKQLDLPMGGERIWVYKLHSVGATEMATMLTQIFLPKGAAPGARAGRSHLAASASPERSSTGTAAPPSRGGPELLGVLGDLSVSQIIPDDRSNSLIIVATERAYSRILGLIKRLDHEGSPLDSASDRVHVYFLANANAEELAGTLGQLGVGVVRGGGGGRPGAPGQPARAAAPNQPGAAAGLFESEVKVASDKPTNSLIIVASGKDYLTLRDIIRKLDLARRQVFIEATILEISLDKARKIGVAFHGASPVATPGSPQQSLFLAGSEPNAAVNSIFFSPAALTGLAAGLRGPAIPEANTILGLPSGTSVPAFGVFIQALQNNNDVNVVSMPHILTSDNEKATIQVGRNLPFPGSLGGFPGGGVPGSTGIPGGGGFGFGTSVQRQDVALKLDITPHVNDSDFVRLEVDNEISDVASENFNGLGPATDKRHIKTNITVRDGQSVVLGGLIKDRVSESVDKIPLLGDIPILGYLFKFTRKTVLKQNLLIIITPYVIKDPDDLRRIFERKIQERKEFLERNSAFTDPNIYDAHPNFARKRGLLEEINRTAIEAELEAAEMRLAEEHFRTRAPEGPVEPAPIITLPLPAPAPTHSPPPPPSAPAPTP